MKAKSIIKRSLAFLLAIMTIMSVGLTNIIALSIDMAEIAANKELASTGANTFTVYFQNNWNWDAVRIYYWGSDSGNSAGWPGDSMTFVKNDGTYDIYKATIPTDVEGIIFNNNNNGKQTPDIKSNTIPAIIQTGACYYMVYKDYSDKCDVFTYRNYEVKADTGGKITSANKSGVYTDTAITISAEASSGYEFDGWTVTNGTVADKTKASTTFTPTNDNAVATAKFKIANHTVTINATTGGTVSPSGDQTVTSGDTLTITATPKDDTYNFTGWTFDPTTASSMITNGSVSSTSITIKPTANVKVTANFDLKSYPVKAEARPEGAGTVSINPSSVTHGSTATLKVDSTNAGYKFNHWEDKNGNTLDSTTVTVTGEATYYAVFDTLTPYQVTITDHGIPAEYTYGSTTYPEGDIGTFKINGNNYETTGNTYEATLYEDDVISFKSGSLVNHYVSSLLINGVECAGDKTNSDYYPGDTPNYWTVGSTITLNSETTKDGMLTVEIFHHLNPTLCIDGAVETEGIGTISAKQGSTTYTTDPEIVDYMETAITYSASTSNGAYYLAKVYDKNTGEVYFTNSDPTIKSVTDRELPAVDADVCLSATFLPLETKKVTVNLTGVAAGVAEATVEGTGSFIKNDDGTFSVAKGTEFKVTVNVPENGAYYIGSFDGASISEQTTFTRSKTFTVEEDTILDVSIVARKKYTVTISNPDETQGTLVPVGDTTVYHGGSLIVRATPKDGYMISKWVVDGKETDNNNSEITLQNITSTRTVSIIWEESKEIKISGRAYPRAAGNVTITGFSGNYQQDAFAGTVYTFTVEDVDPAVYEFTGWTFTGKYKLVEEEGNTLASRTIKIIPLQDLTAVANYNQIARRIYGNGYTHAHIWNSSKDFTTWPGTQMSNEFNNINSVVVPLEATNIKFTKNNGSIVSDDLTLDPNNESYFDEKWDTFNYTIKVGSTEYYVDENIDGTFTCILTLSSNQTAGVYKNTTNALATVDTTDITAKSTVTFIYNPDDNSLTYTVKAYPENTLTVYVDYGASALVPGDEASDNSGKYTAVGQTTFDPDSEGYLEDQGFHYSDSHYDPYYDDTGYRKYLVGDGMNIDIITTLDPAMASVYTIDGYIINSIEYVSATQLNSTTYTASYVFNESSERIVVVPVYQYSGDYIKANNLAEITLYVKKPADFTGDWKTKYMAAYIWYENSAGDTKYHFGVWPGQVMIPTTTGGGNYWKTKVVTTLPGGYNAAGITFSNYGGWEGKYNNTQGVMHPVTDTENVQVYDYYEFITLANKQSKNITFVLKNGNDDNRNSHTWNGSEDYWETYKNIDNDNADIFGEATTSTVTGLYIIRRAPIEHTSNPLNGHFYVDCDVYDATSKEQIGTFKSYELLSLTAENTQIGNVDFANYANKLVKIDYQFRTHQGYGSNNADSAPRFDGQWYDEVKQVTINVKVAQVGVDETDYTKYTVSTTNPGNEDLYGNAYVNEVGNPGGKIDRDTQLKLIAQPLSGFKFVGWYNAETKQLVSKQREYTEGTAVEGATFIAVFQPLKEGSFTINHNLYTGAGDGFTPLPLDGKGKLYIGVEEKNGEIIQKLAINNSVSFEAQEGTTYVIKIATDPDLLDEFDAWYVQTKDKYGRVTYEEIGMDNFGQYGNLADNGGTVVGRNDIVYLTFEHTVEKDEDMTIDIYSNIKKKDDKLTLYYRYNDRSNVDRTVTVKYPLTDEYIAQYGREPHNALIYELAPYVDDYYTNVTWVINKDKFNESAYILWATQEAPTYTVTVSSGSTNLVYSGNPYNTLVEVNASDLGAKSDKGYWIELNKDGSTGQVVAYGRYYGLRVTKDVTLKYIEDENIDFKVVLDAPVYTREQSGVVGESGYIDQVLADYMTSIHVPLFVGDVTANGDEIKTTIFNDQAYVNANSPVTLETLVGMGYEFEYGVILEECRNADDMGKESDPAVLQKYVDKKAGFNDDSNKTRYGTTYNLTDKANITNKNRFLYTVKFNNTEANQNRNFNVYGYIRVKTNVKGAQPVYYFSELQTLNIKEYGNKVGNDQVGADIVDE